MGILSFVVLQLLPAHVSLSCPENRTHTHTHTVRRVIESNKTIFVFLKRPQLLLRPFRCNPRQSETRTFIENPWGATVQHFFFFFSFLISKKTFVPPQTLSGSADIDLKAELSCSLRISFCSTWALQKTKGPFCVASKFRQRLFAYSTASHRTNTTSVGFQDGFCNSRALANRREHLLLTLVSGQLRTHKFPSYYSFIVYITYDKSDYDQQQAIKTGLLLLSDFGPFSVFQVIVLI